MIRIFGGRCNSIIRKLKVQHHRLSSEHEAQLHGMATTTASRRSMTLLYFRHGVVALFNSSSSRNSSNNGSKSKMKNGESSSHLPPQLSSSSSSSSSVSSTAIIATATKSFAIGTCAGILGSLAGMGGGFVMIPLMTSKYIYNNSLQHHPPLTQHQAHGTSLFAVGATGLAGAVSYYYSSCRRDENNNDNTNTTTATGSVVRIPEAVAIAGTAIITARWGAQATLYLSGTTLKRLLGYLMLCMAPIVPAKAYYLEFIIGDQKSPTISKSSEDTSIMNRLLYPTLIGIGSGFLSGLFGVGGGTIVVPALTLCTDLTHHEALGTSLAAMILPALSGTYTHYQAGNCVMRVAPFLATGALLGAYVGAQLSLETDENTLRFGFAALLTVLGVRTLMKT